MVDHDLKQREPVINLIPYYLFKGIIITPVFHTYFRGKIHGLEKVPLEKSLIVVSNHASYFDPPILASSICRPVAYMAKEELFEVPLLKQGIRMYGAYPVKRGSGDRGAIRAALQAIREGWSVGIFLEGTRTSDGRINEPKLGAAMIAAKAQVPLLPVCLWGTEKILRQGVPFPLPVPLTLRVGNLVDPPSSSKRFALEQVTEKCATAINKMHDLGR
ncbi:MAG TPA: 1-acyl-sn-glycerol-3-phosphate acyltransferase [Cyanothece sp. UBA12306]|nr:1-acyl-sn-glycerol-3-phosphate acyltransferase [Cyanothece sp. UBA12306]